jgi:ribosomal protein S18 acetylase RimI-like enzyme
MCSPGKVVIRPAQEKDASHIVGLFRNGFSREITSRTIYGPAGAAAYVRAQISVLENRSRSIYFVAEAANRIEGALELLRSPHNLHLNYIAVTSRLQGQGIGKLLLKKAIMLTGTTSGEITLDVFPDNARAYRWYRGLGFTSLQTSHFLGIPAPHGTNAPCGYIPDLPQADLCQRRFGFSQFTVVTAGHAHLIGRLGKEWFRMNSLACMEEPEVFAILRMLDSHRRIFVISHNDLSLELQGATLLTTSERMSADIVQILNKL